jgi:hypothetical protein
MFPINDVRCAKGGVSFSGVELNFGAGKWIEVRDSYHKRKIGVCEM